MDSKYVDYGFGFAFLSLMILAGYSYATEGVSATVDGPQQPIISSWYPEPRATTTTTVPPSTTSTTSSSTTTTLLKHIPEDSVISIVNVTGHAKQSGDHNHVKTTHKGMVTSGWKQSNCPSTRYYNRYGSWVSGGMYGCEYDNLPDGKYYACEPVSYEQQRQGYSAATGHRSGELLHMTMFGSGCQLFEVSDEMKDWYLYRQVYIQYWNGTWGTYYNPYGYPVPAQIAANFSG